MTGVFMNKKGKMPCDYRNTQSVTIEADTEVLKLQAKELLGPPEARRGRKEPPLEPSGGTWPCQHLKFGRLASRTGR